VRENPIAVWPSAVRCTACGSRRVQVERHLDGSTYTCCGKCGDRIMQTPPSRTRFDGARPDGGAAKEGR
jgi:DNA-directed RNA polymerase subunit RPC12/RpoP